MAKALQPVVAAPEIVFELDQFELEDGDRLVLSGRWFGVRGRRFVRPTLILRAQEGQFRALADLEHKPWAAEDGEPWEAAFSWPHDAEILEAELAVATDVVVHLPAPGADIGAPRRLLAAPDRERVVSGADRDTATGERDQPAPEAEPESATAPEPEPSAARAQKPRRARSGAENERLERALEGAREERDELRSGLEAARAELEATRAALEVAASERDAATAAAEAAQLEAASAIARRDAAVSSADEALAARDAAVAAWDELTEARERERELRDRLAAERDEAKAALQRLESERVQAVQGDQQISSERDDAANTRGAALVMRNATMANPAFERHAGWFRRALAIGVLIVAAFALLIILHVL